MRTCVDVDCVLSNVGVWLWSRLYCRNFPSKTLRNYRDMQLQYKKRVATSMRELMRRVSSVNFKADITHKCNLEKTYTIRICTLRNANNVLHPTKRRKVGGTTSYTHLETELSRAEDRLRRVEVQLVDLREASRIHELVGEQDPWYFQYGRKRKRAETIIVAECTIPVHPCVSREKADSGGY
jgi:hypothetical protein